MNLLQFVASVVASISWPIVVVFIVMTLRVPLTELLLSIAKLKYKDLELEFKKLSVVGELIPETKIGRVEKEKVMISSVEMEMSEIARKNPLSAIVLSWMTVEASLVETVTRLTISSEVLSSRSVMQNIDYLKRHSEISDNLLMSIQTLRDIRNQVAHGGRMSEDVEHALAYVEIAERVVGSLRNLKRYH